jgi:hypothetical protein
MALQMVKWEERGENTSGDQCAVEQSRTLLLQTLEAADKGAKLDTLLLVAHVPHVDKAARQWAVAYSELAERLLLSSSVIILPWGKITNLEIAASRRAANGQTEKPSAEWRLSGASVIRYNESLK